MTGGPPRSPGGDQAFAYSREELIRRGLSRCLTVRGVARHVIGRTTRSLPGAVAVGQRFRKVGPVPGEHYVQVARPVPDERAVPPRVRMIGRPSVERRFNSRCIEWGRLDSRRRRVVGGRCGAQAL
jgi:hypothetical protein